MSGSSSSPPSVTSPTTRLFSPTTSSRGTQSRTHRDAAAREILTSSAKGWNPLQINKRSDSPSKPSIASESSAARDTGVRRTSSSFKHVKSHSLVSNSIFKSPPTAETQRLQSTKHLSFIDTKMTASNSSSSISNSNSSGSVGLGISADQRRSPSGTRKASSGKSNNPSVTRRVSNGTERKVSGGALSPLDHQPENQPESPNARANGTRKPRQSMGLTGLQKGALVTKSPFLQGDHEERRSPEKLASPIKLGSPGRRALEAATPGRSTSPGRFSGSPGRFSSPTVPDKEDVFTSPATLSAISKSAIQTVPGPYIQSPLSSSTSGRSGYDQTAESPGRDSTSNSIPFPRGDETPSPSSTPTRGLVMPSSRAAATPTPTKSSITQRRLRGPRLSGGLDSPSDKKKTVTFRDGPVDVKEFDRESVDDAESDARWDGDDSDDDDELRLGSYPTSNQRVDGSGGGMLVMDEGEDGSVDYHSRDAADESTTANFIDSLVEDGYFSPPALDTPQMAGLPEESATQTIDSVLAFTPRLDTPSLGGSILATPLDENMPFPMPPSRDDDDVDEYGVPYGRTHHAERAALAHATEVAADHHAPVPQPSLPREGASSGAPLLRTANAAEPAAAQKSMPIANDKDGPHAHQDGSFIDPFLTIQTATKVFGPGTSTQSTQREEDGIPLGRTSHAERAKVARMLATQSLGLGLPRRPAVTGTFQDDVSEDGSFEFQDSDDDDYALPGHQRAEETEKVARVDEANHMAASVSISAASSPPPAPQRHASDDTDHDFGDSHRASYIATSVLSPVGTQSAKRSLPKPPKPQPVGIPEPVNGRVPSAERSNDSPNRFSLALPFSLPSIGRTSPLFASTAFRGPSDSSSTDREESRPATPPSSSWVPSVVSPSRIPDFDFEGDDKTSFGDLDGGLSASLAFKMVEDALPVLGAPLVSSRTAGASVTTAEPSSPAARPSSADETSSTGNNNAGVRQRISRDMIRQKLEQRKALGDSKSDEESLKASSATGDMSMISMAEKALTQVEKALPPAPDQRMASSAARTSTDSTRHTEAPDRPQLKSREHTRSAQEVLQQAQREGTIHDPKSALDRLVSGFAATKVDDSARSVTSQTRASFSTATALRQPDQTPVDAKRISSLRPLEQADSKATQDLPPPTPTKDSLKTARQPSMSKVDSSASRPRRKRSLSASDARRRSQIMSRNSGTLDNIKFQEDQSILVAMEDEMEHLSSDRPYRIREQRQKIVARSDDKVKHSGAGDLDKGRAWRQLRRPSDINQYAEELRAIKAKKDTASKFGTIFVKVLGIESLNIPMPAQPTAFCITLDNGIDYIRTNYSTLKEGARVNQEFALVEHANFEFALGLEIRRDPHIIKMVHDNMQSGASRNAPETASVSSVRGNGFKHLFQSPRKMSKAPVRPATPQEPPKDEDNICRYFGTGDSTIARTHIAFNPIAKECDARILEIRYPMFGIRRIQGVPPILRKPAVEGLPAPPGSVPEKKLLAKVTLQIFRLPPLPGLTHEQLPQSIDDCLRGMRHHTWHEQEHLEGTLTQRGGDCQVPRRRSFRLKGSNLIAGNPVTKKEVVKIDLQQMIGAKDNNTPDGAAKDEDEGLSSMPRSIRLMFKGDEDIVFSADTDKEKQKWLAAFASLVERGIPSNPLWAEVLADQQRQTRIKGRQSSISAAVTS